MSATELTFPTIDLPDSPERRQSTQLRAFLEMGLAEVRDDRPGSSLPRTDVESQTTTGRAVQADIQQPVFNTSRRASRSASKVAQLLLPLEASPLDVSPPRSLKINPAHSTRNFALLDFSDNASRARSSVLAPPPPQAPLPPIPSLYTSVSPTSAPIRVTRSSSIHKLGSLAVVDLVGSTRRPPMPVPSFALSGNESTTPPSTKSPPQPPTSPQSLHPMSPAAIPTAAARRLTRRPEGFIPRPPNAWILYRSEQIRNLKKDPELSRKPQSDISKIIGAMWRGESEDVKLWYSREAGVKKLEHAQQYPDYSFTPVRKERSKAANLLSSLQLPPHSVAGRSDRPVQRPSTAPEAGAPKRRRARAATTTDRYIPQSLETPYDASISNSPYDHHSTDFLDKYALQFGRGAADSLATSCSDTYLHEDRLDELVTSFDESWIPQESISYQPGEYQSGSLASGWDAALYPGFHQPPLSAPAVMGHFDFSTTATLDYGLAIPGTSYHGEYTTSVGNGASSQGAHSPPERDPHPLSPHQRALYSTSCLSPRSNFPANHFDASRGVGPTDTSIPVDTDEADVQEYLAYREMEEKLSAERSSTRLKLTGYEVPMREEISYSFPASELRPVA